jgi:hypothetical protein
MNRSNILSENLTVKKMQRNYFYMLIYIGFWGNHPVVCAQLNESDTARYQIQAGLTGLSQSGNVEFLAIRSKAELLYSLPHSVVFKSQTITLYQKFGKFKADEDLLSRNFLYWNPQSLWYPFAISFVQTNYRRKIDLRWFGGAGITYQLLRSKTNKLKLSAGLIHETSRFSSDQFNTRNYNGSQSISLWRVTTFVSGWHTFPSIPFSLDYMAYWQPGFDSVANTRLQAEITARIPLYRGVSVSCNYLIAYEQVTVQNVTQTDRIVTFGITYNLKG